MMFIPQVNDFTKDIGGKLGIVQRAMRFFFAVVGKTGGGGDARGRFARRSGR